MAYRKLYTQIYIPPKLFSKNLDAYINAWNDQYWDENGKFKRKGARIIGDGEIGILHALSYILIDRISLKNRQTRQSRYSEAINVTNPIEFLVNTNDIRNVMLTNKKKSLSLNTVKNRLLKLEQAGFINRKFLKSKSRYVMNFSQFLLPVMDEEHGILLNNTNFINTVNQDIKITYNQDLANYTNTIIKKEIKKEQFTIVDKGNGASTKKITKTQEQPKKTRPTEAIQNIPTIKTKKYSKKIAKIFNIPAEQELELSQNFQNNLPLETEDNKNSQKVSKAKQLKNDFERLRKNFALAFYTRFIVTFYPWNYKNYLPDSAGSSTIFYVEQSLNKIETDKNYYFGACKTEEHLQYQAMKLEKALNSTFLNYQKKLKQNPDYNWKFNYPNTFLSRPPGINSFSFKNSILHIEKSLIRTNKINVEYEKEMTKYKMKVIQNEENKLIHTAVWYIHQKTGKINKNINIALDYFKNDEELCNNFKAFILNNFAVKKFMQNKNFVPDEELINNCFIRQDKLETEINELLPILHKKVRYSEQKRLKLRKYIQFLGTDNMPKPRLYNQQAYNFINNFIN